MPRRLSVERTGEPLDLVESPAPSQHHLQEVTWPNTQLIPADDLWLDGDCLVIERGTSLPSISIALRCLASSGEVVFVEFKAGPQNPGFRRALARLIYFGSDLGGSRRSLRPRSGVALLAQRTPPEHLAGWQYSRASQR